MSLCTKESPDRNAKIHDGMKSTIDAFSRREWLQCPHCGRGWYAPKKEEKKGTE